VVKHQLVDVEAGGGDSLGDVAEQLGERRRLLVEVDESEGAPALQADGLERDVGEVDALALRSGSSAQRPVQVVRPGVIGALERLAVARLLDDDRPAVPADVDERPLLAVLALDEQDGHLPGPTGDDVARLAEAADVVPGAAEDRLLLARQHRRVAVPVPGRGRFGHVAHAQMVRIIGAGVHLAVEIL
jgi:hypothetical protein